MSYCEYIRSIRNDSSEDSRLHQHYHDHQYGFAIENDDELFGRLLLEINQAGLSWTLMLRKQENFRKAYANFSIQQVAHFTEADRMRLMADVGIVRNGLKINAAIYNANAILALQSEYGSFKNWLNIHHPLAKEQWIKLFKKHFKFVGGEIVNEFLMSTGYLEGSHDEDCPVLDAIKKSRR